MKFKHIELIIVLFLVFLNLMINHTILIILSLFIMFYFVVRLRWILAKNNVVEGSELL